MKGKQVAALLLSAMLAATVLTGCADGSAAPAPAVTPSETAPEVKQPESQEATVFEDSVDWDAEYDVIVVGFGGAGAVTAVTAADAGAKVLLLEKAPRGHEGGNTKYCAQIILDFTEEERAEAIAYLKEGVRHNYTTPSDGMIEKYVDMVTENDVWVREVTGMEPVPYAKASMPEYPGYDSGAAMHAITVDGTYFQGAFWRELTRIVEERADKIDVWYEAPGKKLIQDPDTKIVHGVTAEVEGRMVNLRARNGVVLCTGGFENNLEMIQNYLRLPYAYSKGGQYNEGDGITMAIDVGAKLWHMSAMSGPDINVKNHDTNTTFGYSMQGAKSFACTGFSTGPVIFVGPDGSRFTDEATGTKHGHVLYHGDWQCMQIPLPAYVVFDEAARLAAPVYYSWSEGSEKELKEGYLIQADTLEELAAATGIDAEGLKAQVERYNSYCAAGYDPEQQRAAKYLNPISDKGPYYAMEVVPSFTNTQGGPERNTEGEILDVWGNPIPHLYSAGELGSLYSDLYQGAGNLGECIAFGRISGANAATPKSDVAQKSVMEGKTPFVPAAEADEVQAEGLVGEATGMGGKLILSVTLNGDVISAVEILSHTETPGVSDRAIEQIPAAIVANNSADVDTVSGATVTSRAIMEAVKNALSKK